MPCRLRIRDDLSVNDIVRLSRDHLIKVTPHVGNWTPTDMVVPTLGVSVLCVDCTIGERDYNAHPHLFIRGGKAQVLCEHADILTTHARVTSGEYTYAVGTPVSEIHVGALHTLYPNADIVTHSEHLAQHKDITLAMLEIITKISPGYVWWRFVHEDGSVRAFRKEDLPNKTQWHLFRDKIFRLTNDKRGWLIHNRGNILMDVIQQSRMGVEPEIYHLSGQDMVRYLGSEMTAISRMYDHVRKQLGLSQETITYNLVPFSSFRFATRPDQASACELLCVKLAEGIEGEALQPYVLDTSDVLMGSDTRCYYTQHDCLANDDRVVVTPIAREWPMETCAKYLALMKAAAA